MPEVGAGVHAALGQQPLELGAREVGVEHQAGAFPHGVEVAGGAQRVAPGRRTPVLPHDGPVPRVAGPAVPYHRRLPLVGDADGRHRLIEVGTQLGEGGLHGVPDLAGVVLDPSRSGEVLGELAVGPARRLALLVHGEGPDARGAGIDGDHDGHSPATVAAFMARSWRGRLWKTTASAARR